MERYGMSNLGFSSSTGAAKAVLNSVLKNTMNREKLKIHPHPKRLPFSPSPPLSFSNLLFSHTVAFQLWLWNNELNFNLT